MPPHTRRTGAGLNSGTAAGNGSSARAPDPRQRKRRAANPAKLVKKALALLEKRLDDGDLKESSLADVIRLLKISADVQHRAPREVMVRWVDPEEWAKRKKG